jgi:ribosomal-protein-alanine N-acetyltransferase
MQREFPATEGQWITMMAVVLEKPLCNIGRVEIVWMIRRHIPAVLTIEGESFDFAWTQEEFIRRLRQQNCIGMVALWNEPGVPERPVGYMVYELYPTKIHLVKFAVSPDKRRCGIGTEMAAKLVSKLSQHRRRRIVLECSERNVECQLFWRSCGFRAAAVLRNFYDDRSKGGDAYSFRFVYGRDEMPNRQDHVRAMA